MAVVLSEMIALTGKDVLEHLDRAAEVPVITSAAAQGDVLVVRVNRRPATTPMPSCLVAVASEISSNTHTLHPVGTAYFDPGADEQLLGIMTIEPGAEVFLSHQEHGGLLFREGTYEVRRQAELDRVVAD